MRSQRRKNRAVVGFAAVSLAWSGWMALADEPKTAEPTRKDGNSKTATESKVGIRPEPEVIAPRRANGSLWSNGGRSIFEDVRANSVGDLLTIFVNESSTASSTASTKSDKAESANFGGGTGFLNRFFKAFGASSSGSMTGQGQTSRTGQLSTRLTVVVKEVLPNGNLLIEGSRVVTVNKETHKITLTGLVRPQDILPDNSVSSIQIANAAILLDGKGTVGDRQRKGIITRIFDLIF